MTETEEDVRQRAQIAADLQQKPQYMITVKHSASKWGFTSKPQQPFDQQSADVVQPSI